MKLGLCVDILRLIVWVVSTTISDARKLNYYHREVKRILEARAK